MFRTRSNKTVRGFFDLGLSLALLSIFGITVSIISANAPEPTTKSYRSEMKASSLDARTINTGERESKKLPIKSLTHPLPFLSRLIPAVLLSV